MKNTFLTTIALLLTTLTIFSCSKEEIQTTENETSLSLLRVISPSEYPLNLLSDKELRAFDTTLIWEDDQLVSGSFEPLAETLNERQLDELMKAIYGEDVVRVDESTDAPSYRGGGTYYLAHHRKILGNCVRWTGSFCAIYISGPHK